MAKAKRDNGSHFGYGSVASGKYQAEASLGYHPISRKADTLSPFTRCRPRKEATDAARCLPNRAGIVALI